MCTAGPGEPDAPPPRTYFDVIPADARARIDELAKYPKTFALPFDLAARFPQLVPKVAVILHPRRVSTPISVRCSKIGGHIYWPRDEAWATCPDHPGNPLVPVMQLTKRDVPTLPFPKGTDLFQMLWCPTSHHNDEYATYCPKPAFFWPTMKKEETLLPANEVPETNQHYWLQQFVPRECAVFPERVKEYPDLRELRPSEAAELCEEEISAYLGKQTEEDLFGPEMGNMLDRTNYEGWVPMSYGSKIGGYPTWIQDHGLENPCPVCGEKMQYFLTLSAVEYGKDRWVPLGEYETLKTPGGSNVFCETLDILGEGHYDVLACASCPDMPTMAYHDC